MFILRFPCTSECLCQPIHWHHLFRSSHCQTLNKNNYSLTDILHCRYCGLIVKIFQSYFGSYKITQEIFLINVICCAIWCDISRKASQMYKSNMLIYSTVLKFQDQACKKTYYILGELTGRNHESKSLKSINYLYIIQLKGKNHIRLPRAVYSNIMNPNS